MNVTGPGQDVVEGQTDAPLPGPHARTRVERDDEPERVDEVGRIAEQQAPLVQGLVDQAKIAVLQVAQAAVDQLGAGAAGGRGEITLVDEGDAPAVQGRVQGDAGAGDAAPDNEQIKFRAREYIEVPVHSTLVPLTSPPEKPFA